MNSTVIPLTVSAFQTRQLCEVLGLRTGTRIVMRTTPTPVIVTTVEMQRKHEGLKVTTVPRMVALSRRKCRTELETTSVLVQDSAVSTLVAVIVSAGSWLSTQQNQSQGTPNPEP